MYISKLTAIFKGFIVLYRNQFLTLLLLLFLEGIAASCAVLTLAPLADFILDPALKNPGRITLFVLHKMALINVVPSFASFGGLFVGANLANGVLQVLIRYAILKIKYKVVRELFGDALGRFFGARWEFFSGVEQGRLLGTLNKELNNIGDTLGHIAILFAQLIQLLIYLVVPMFLNPRMTFTTIILACIVSTVVLE